ncbi:MAG: hypothetical protein JW786_10105 [Desulfobacterales bacterium]|nr:hypothetical protein [Desulfobacterales bacterium]
MGDGNLPFDIKSICITVFENRTSETGLENIFTNDLAYEFTCSNQVALATKEKADTFLTGVIESIQIESISHRRKLSAIERRVKVILSLSLSDRAGNLIWSLKRISANETYEVASNKLTTEQNRKIALSTLSKKTAERVFDRLTENF